MIKKKIAIVFLLIMTAFRLVGGYSLVYAIPETPDVPELPGEAPETPDTPDEPDAPEEPNHEEEELVEENTTEENTTTEEESQNTDADQSPQEENAAPETEYTNDTGNEDQGGQVGDVAIKTGDAEAAGAIVNTGNTNVATVPGSGDSNIGDGSPDVNIANTGNGSGSDNSASVSDNGTNTTNQNNSALLNNNLDVDTNTGHNSASRNVGNSSIETGNAVSTGTITNIANTNIAGVTVSEFNIIEDQTGDLSLDFAANCVSGCGGGASIVNSDNGSQSTNTGNLSMDETNSTFQNNEVGLENNLTLAANSGENKADNNTGGDSSITTGDATVVGNVLNFLNNNFAGNVAYGVVNILGNLTGDIILSEQQLEALFGPSLNLANTNNGSDSTNTTSADTTNVDEYYQFNSADIVNNLDIEANTGENVASNNTSGNNSIDTGDSNVDVNVLNIANNNFVGGNWWIVLVNEAGNWVGHIIGLPGTTVGNNIAMSQGSAQTSPQGDVTVENNGNGQGSANSGQVNQSTVNTTNQTNNAGIVNNIDLSANTGRNSASRNTGGANSIETGDANVSLNLINFVNNNFAGGNVFLTVVNVFGNWIGDFVTPGAAKAQDPDDTGIGGTSDVPNQSSESNSNNSSSSNSSQSSSANSSSNSVSSTTQTLETSTKVYQKSKLSFVSSSTEGEDTSEDLALGNTQVAGANDSNDKVKINLAWALLLLPGALLLKIVRGRFSAN